MLALSGVGGVALGYVLRVLIGLAQRGSVDFETKQKLLRAQEPPDSWYLPYINSRLQLPAAARRPSRPFVRPELPFIRPPISSLGPRTYRYLQKHGLTGRKE